MSRRLFAVGLLLMLAGLAFAQVPRVSPPDRYFFYKNGPMPVPVYDGGTGTRSVQDARRVLQVPSTTQDETINGDWQVLGNWTFRSGVTVRDSGFRIVDDQDTTKRAKFQLSELGNGHEHYYVLPDTSGRVMLDGRTGMFAGAAFFIRHPSSSLQRLTFDVGAPGLSSTIHSITTPTAHADSAIFTHYLPHRSGTFAMRQDISDTSAVYVRADGTRELTAAWDAGGFEIRSSTFESDVATGTAPLTIASTTKVTNLNADWLDGFNTQTNASGAVVTTGGAVDISDKVLDAATCKIGDPGSGTFIEFEIDSLTDDGDDLELVVPVLTGSRKQVFADTSGTFVLAAGAQTLTGKTVALASNIVSGTTAQWNAANTDGDFLTHASGAVSPTATGLIMPLTHVVDSRFIVKDEGDTTKKVQIQASGITTGTTRTLTAPNFDGTIATLAGAESPTNKTFNVTSNVPYIVDTVRADGLVADKSELPWISNPGAGMYAIDYYVVITTGSGVGTATLDFQYDDKAMDDNSQSSAALSGAVTGGHIYGRLVVYLDDAAGDIDYYMTRPATSTYALYLTCTRLW